MLDDDGDIHADERPHIGGQRAIARHDHDDFVYARQARHHLLDPRIKAACLGIHLFEQRHLVGIRRPGQRIDRQVQPMAGQRVPRGHSVAAAAAGNCTSRPGCLGQRRQNDLVRVGEAGFLAGEGAHANALFDALRTLLHDAVFERPGFLPAQLKVEICVVHGVAHDGAEGI